MIRDILVRRFAEAACARGIAPQRGARRGGAWRRPQDSADWLAAGALAAIIAVAITAAWIFGGLGLSPGWQAAAELAAGYPVRSGGEPR
jgi:hypothetical protein